MKSITIIAIMLLALSSAQAYTLKLDLDEDLDPATMQTTTQAEENIVSIQVWPDQPGEIVNNLYMLVDGPVTLIRFVAGVWALEGPFCPEQPAWRVAISRVPGEAHRVEFLPASTPLENTTWGHVKAVNR